MESFEHSVSLWIEKIKQGDQEAVGPLWSRYFERLVRVAGRKLGGASRRIADEEDVAVSVFQSLFRGAAEGRFQVLADRDDLWRLLVAIAGQKAVDQIRRQVSQKRGGGIVRGDSLFGEQNDDGPRGFERFLSSEPTPEFLAVIEEQEHRLFEKLRDDVQRQIARLRLEGYSHEEIAQKLQVSLRTVERKSNMIREIWGRELSHE